MYFRFLIILQLSFNLVALFVSNTWQFRRSLKKVQNIKILKYVILFIKYLEMSLPKDQYSLANVLDVIDTSDSGAGRIYFWGSKSFECRRHEPTRGVRG
jgi:predicted nucleic acid binding AN1-type Zn finger protein